MDLTDRSVANFIDRLSHKVMGSESSDMLVFWSGVAAAVIGGLVVFFAERFYDWWSRPVLKFIAEHADLSEADTPFAYTDAAGNLRRTNARYLRLKIVNSGRSTARGCRLYCQDLQITDPNNVVEVITKGDLFELQWSHGHDADNTIRESVIPSKVGRWGDIVYSVQYQPGPATLMLAAERNPARLAQKMNRQGDFEMVVTVAGDNFEPVSHTVQFRNGATPTDLVFID